MKDSEYAILGALVCLLVGWFLSRDRESPAPVEPEARLEVVESSLENDSLHREMLKRFRDAALQLDLSATSSGFTMEEARARSQYLKGIEEDTVWIRLTKPPERKTHRYKKYWPW